MESSTDRITRAVFQPIRVGRRLVVVPAWLDPPLDPESIPIRLDPGLAFGTGAHPTTALCLEALERHVAPGTAVLDLGTGTGILAIAAAKLGAASVLAVDIDSDAVRVARENVIASDVTEHVRVEQGSLGQVLSAQWGVTQAPFVVANILLSVIVDFFEQGLCNAVTPGGWLVLSGILRTQTPEIHAQLRWHGLELLAREQMEEWVCIIARKG